MLFDEFLEIVLYLVTRLISFDCNSLLDKSNDVLEFVL